MNGPPIHLVMRGKEPIAWWFDPRDAQKHRDRLIGESGESEWGYSVEVVPAGSPMPEIARW